MDNIVLLKNNLLTNRPQNNISKIQNNPSSSKYSINYESTDNQNFEDKFFVSKDQMNKPKISLINNKFDIKFTNSDENSYQGDINLEKDVIFSQDHQQVPSSNRKIFTNTFTNFINQIDLNSQLNKTLKVQENKNNHNISNNPFKNIIDFKSASNKGNLNFNIDFLSQRKGYSQSHNFTNKNFFSFINNINSNESKVPRFASTNQYKKPDTRVLSRIDKLYCDLKEKEKKIENIIEPFLSKNKKTTFNEKVKSIHSSANFKPKENSFLKINIYNNNHEDIGFMNNLLSNKIILNNLNYQNIHNFKKNNSYNFKQILSPNIKPKNMNISTKMVKIKDDLEKIAFSSEENLFSFNFNSNENETKINLEKEKEIYTDNKNSNEINKEKESVINIDLSISENEKKTHKKTLSDIPSIMRNSNLNLLLYDDQNCINNKENELNDYKIISSKPVLEANSKSSKTIKYKNKFKENFTSCQNFYRNVEIEPFNADGDREYQSNSKNKMKSTFSTNWIKNYEMPFNKQEKVYDVKFNIKNENTKGNKMILVNQELKENKYFDNIKFNYLMKNFKRFKEFIKKPVTLIKRIKSNAIPVNKNNTDEKENILKQLKNITLKKEIQKKNLL